MAAFMSPYPGSRFVFASAREAIFDKDGLLEVTDAAQIAELESAIAVGNPLRKLTDEEAKKVKAAQDAAAKAEVAAAAAKV